MERAVFAAWLTGLSLLTWRQLQVAPWKPPPPGRYLAASGLYAVLGLVATAPPAAPAAAAVAWAFNLALFLQVLPQATGQPAAAAAAAGAARTASQERAVHA